MTAILPARRSRGGGRAVRRGGGGVAVDSRTAGRSGWVVRLFGLLFTALLLAMLGRVVQLQAWPDPRLAEAVAVRVAQASSPGVRGDVRDRRGRPLAVSYFGRRAFVDPALMPMDPEGFAEALHRISAATGVPLVDVVQRVVPRVDANAARLAELGHDPMDPGVRRQLHRLSGLSRYVSLGDVLDAEQEGMVLALLEVERSARRQPYMGLELREVRGTAAADAVGSILGLVGVDDRERPVGATGAELTLDSSLRPVHGRLRYAHDSGRRPLWIEPGGLVPPTRGDDVRLSIDLVVQQIAVDELRRGMEDADAAGGRVVIVDPVTGEVLAMADLYRDVEGAVEFDWTSVPRRSDDGDGTRYVVLQDDPLRRVHSSLGRNRCVEDVYEPGSTFKPFVWAVATELGLARQDEVFKTGMSWKVPYAGRVIRDVTRRDEMTWAEVLIHSSNIGMAQVAERMSARQLRDAVVRFGFGSRTNIGLPGESPGIVTTARRWTRYSQTSVAMGHEVAVTPVQIARAFSVFARTGERAGTMPRLRLTAAERDEPEVSLRVLPADVANLAREVMGGVTERLDERLVRGGTLEAKPRYPMFGKSGTAEIPLGSPPAGGRLPRGSDGYFKDQYFSSFLAAAPTDEPRIVVLVVIDDPGPSRVKSRTHYGSAVAGPVVRRIVDAVLPVLGVPAPECSEESGISGSRLARVGG